MLLGLFDGRERESHSKVIILASVMHARSLM